MRATFKASLMVVLCVALWPAFVGAQPPEPKGRLVYSDDFSDGTKSGLEDNVNATDFQRGFHDPGVYHLKLLSNNDTRWVVLPEQSYGTFTLELDLWDNSDDLVRGDVSQGVVFRVQDDTHLYAVLIDPREGRYVVRKLDGQDRWSDLVPLKASPLVKRRDVINHLRVDADGDTFTIYLNGEQLASVTDAAYPKGSIGMIARNDDALEPHFHFDNVKIFTVDMPAPAPTTMPDTSLTSDPVPLVLLCVALALMGLSVLIRQRQYEKS